MHFIIIIKMVIEMKKTLWKLFQKTGEVKYYLLLKELESKRGKDDRKYRRDCS